MSSKIKIAGVVPPGKHEKQALAAFGMSPKGLETFEEVYGSVRPRNLSFRELEKLIGPEGLKLLDADLHQSNVLLERDPDGNVIGLGNARVEVRNFIAQYVHPPQREGGYEPISRSRRITHLMNVYDTGTNEQVKQLFIKSPHSEGEVVYARAASKLEWGPRVYASHWGELPVKVARDQKVGVEVGVWPEAELDFETGLSERRLGLTLEHYTETYKPRPGLSLESETRHGGYVVESHMTRGSSIRRKGITLSREECEALGNNLGTMLQQMLGEDVIYDFRRFASSHMRLLTHEDGVDEARKFCYNSSEGRALGTARSISELCKLIESRRPEHLQSHLTPKNFRWGVMNDFASWVSTSFEDEELGKRLNEVKFNKRNPDKTRDEVLEVLKSRRASVRLLDFSSIVNLKKDVSQEKRDEFIVRQLKEIARVFVSYLSERGGAVAYKEFKDAFIDVPGGILERWFGGRRRQLSDYLGRVRSELTTEGEESIRREYYRFFREADRAGRKVEPVSLGDEERDAFNSARRTYLISLDRYGMPHRATQYLLDDVFGLLQRNTEEFGDLHFRVDSLPDNSTAVEVLKAAGRVPIAGYRIKGYDAEEASHAMRASENDIGPRIISLSPIDEGVHVSEFKHGATIADLRHQLSPAQCSKLGFDLARNFHVMLSKLGVIPDITAEGTMFIDDGRRINTLHADWKDAIDLRKSDDEARRGALVEGVKQTVLLCKSLDHGEHALKAFRCSLPDIVDEVPWDRAGREAYSHEWYRDLLAEALDGLSADQGLRDFIEASITTMQVKSELRSRKMNSIERQQDSNPPIAYSSKNKGRLKELRPLMVEALRGLHEMGYIDDCVADVASIQVLLPGGRETMEAAREGTADLSKGAFMIRLYPFEHDHTRSDENLFLVYFTENSVSLPHVMDPVERDNWIKHRVIRRPSSHLKRT